jgi:hypothetical protein
LVELAPALPQIDVAVFVRVLPETETPTALVHTTFTTVLDVVKLAASVIGPLIVRLAGLLDPV